MEGSSSSSSSLFSYSDSAEKPSELEMLQKEQEEKALKVEELKRQIAETKIRLDKTKKEVPEEKMEAFRNLTEKYNSTRDEYKAMLGGDNKSSQRGNK